MWSIKGTWFWIGTLTCKGPGDESWCMQFLWTASSWISSSRWKCSTGTSFRASRLLQYNLRDCSQEGVSSDRIRVMICFSRCSSAVRTSHDITTWGSGGGGLESFHRSAASRKRRRKVNPVLGGYNWATFFFLSFFLFFFFVYIYIHTHTHTGTWSSRMGESQMRQKNMVFSSTGL
jgi:hypothetical protein